MDGVLADFDSAKRAILDKIPNHDDLTPQELWGVLSEHKDLYLHLTPTPDANLLVGCVSLLARSYNTSVAVLTALPSLGDFPDAAAHKQIWIEKHYPQLAGDVRFGPYSVDKQNHARPGDVLIDDRQMNINQWESKGGKGILHTSAFSSLDKLVQYLREIKK